ncbi:MAG: arylamine N-acetyltransferase [Pirellulales bacterium]
MTSEPQPDTPLDLKAYFARIEHAGGRRRGTDTLRAIHLAHATHIPFENIDVLLGEPIRLDLPGLFDKLVTRRRGGYCFEQNSLLAAALETLGFRVKRLLARVRVDSGRLLPRTHMVLEVAAGRRAWLCDVGFGSWGLLEPLALAAGESRQFIWDYRLSRAGNEWWLQARQGDVWRDLYSFTRAEQLQVDFEPANHYTSTHPDSRFTHTLTAQRPLPEARYLLRGRELIVATAEGITTRGLTDDCELLGVLAECFQLEVPRGKWMPPVEQVVPSEPSEQ